MRHVCRLCYAWSQADVRCRQLAASDETSVILFDLSATKRAQRGGPNLSAGQEEERGHTSHKLQNQDIRQQIAFAGGRWEVVGSKRSNSTTISAGTQAVPNHHHTVQTHWETTEETKARPEPQNPATAICSRQEREKKGRETKRKTGRTDSKPYKHCRHTTDKCNSVTRALASAA